MNNVIESSMSKRPVTVKCEDSLLKAYQKMRKQGYRHLPVVGDDGELIGIISDRDFQRAMWPTRPTIGMVNTASISLFRKDAKVGDSMSWPVKTLSANSSILSAVNLMLREKISAIVVTENEEIVGIVTNDDLLHLLAELLPKDKDWRRKTMTMLIKSQVGQLFNILSNAGI